MSLNKPIIAGLKQSVKVTAYLDYRLYLEALYRHLRSQHETYSYLLFSQDLGFSKTNVIHLIIRGKRPLTVKAARKIIEALELTAGDRQYFETLVEYQCARDPAKRESLFKKLVQNKARSLSSDQEKARLEFFNEWYHPAIFEMAHMPHFRSDPDWIVDRLQMRIRPEQARRSLQLLQSLGLLHIDQITNQLRPSEATVTTGDEIASVAVIRYHQKMIDLGKESMTSTHEDLRDISAITVCVSADIATQMKEEIRAFRKKLLALSGDARQADRVYQLNLQLFPLTKPEDPS